jgi:predicted MFS family arabinose efflux permease
VTSDSAASPDPTPTSASQRTLYAIYAAGITTNILGSMIKLAATLWAIQIGMSGSLIGIAIGAGGLLPFFFAVHGGVLMDRFGTRRVNLVFAVVASVVVLLYPFLPYASALIALQCISGLTLNIGWMGAQTLIVQFAPGDTTAMARFSMASRFGNLVSPALTGVVWDNIGPFWTFMFIGFWALVTVVAVYLVPNTNTDASGEGVKVKLSTLVPRFSEYFDAFALIAIPMIAFLVANTFLRIASSAINGSFYVVYLEGIGISGTTIGVLLGIGEGFGMFGASTAAWLERKLTPHWTMLIFHTLSLFCVVVTPWLGGYLPVLVLMMAIRGWSQGLSQPVMFAILSREVGPDEQGRAIGMRSTINRLAQLGVPPIMGLVVDATSLLDSFAIVGGVLLAFAAATAIVFARHRRLHPA